MKKKGILVVSFGTSHLDAMEKTIQVMEEEIAKHYTDYQVYRAFTSQMIIKKLKKLELLSVMTVKEALEKMAEDGIQTVIVQPTHIINGYENDKMLEDVRAFKGKFSEIRVGTPMLTSTDDYKKAIHALVEDVALERDETLILMGHGTDHHANAAYPALEYILQTLGYSHIHVATVEGYPELKDVVAKMEEKKVKKIALLPFMFVAGDHAKNDMAGDEDSWKEELEKAGYQVRPILKGLGEFPSIRNIFMEHLEEVL